jgi:hypothetical protein
VREKDQKNTKKKKSIFKNLVLNCSQKDERRIKDFQPGFG